MPFFSQESAVGATMVVTATVARMERKEDLVRVTLRAEERKEGSHARRP